MAKEKSQSEFVLVECISQYRMRYVVEVPKGNTDWALDTVTMNEAVEFSQEWLGETIFSHRPIKKKQFIKLFDKDNDYLYDMDDEEKITKFVTRIDKTKEE